MKINANLKVISKETKTGVSAKTGKEWSMDEYLLLEDLEREDGSHNETYITATASQTIGELEVGGSYNCNLFLSSRESSGKYYTSFRITYAVLTNAPEVKEEKTVMEDDENCIPF